MNKENVMIIKLLKLNNYYFIKFLRNRQKKGLLTMRRAILAKSISEVYIKYGFSMGDIDIYIVHYKQKGCCCYTFFQGFSPFIHIYLYI